MTKTDKDLIAEAYKQVYTEAVQPHVLQQVVDLFTKLGWGSRLFKDGTGIAAKQDDDRNVEHDIYFYEFKGNIHFYAHAKMGWDGGIQENDVHIPITGKDEYVVPIDSGIEQAVKIAVDETLSAQLPEGPSETEINQFNADERERSRTDRGF